MAAGRLGCPPSHILAWRPGHGDTLTQHLGFLAPRVPWPRRPPWAVSDVWVSHPDCQSQPLLFPHSARSALEGGRRSPRIPTAGKHVSSEIIYSQDQKGGQRWVASVLCLQPRGVAIQILESCLEDSRLPVVLLLLVRAERTTWDTFLHSYFQGSW